MRIAVADDEPMVLLYLQELLAELGHHVVSAAANGAELVQQCRASAPEVVLTDFLMPQLDGLQALREINRHHPVGAIIVTGHDVREEVQKAAAEFPAFVCLRKPVGQADLSAAIQVIAAQQAQPTRDRTRPPRNEKRVPASTRLTATKLRHDAGRYALSLVTVAVALLIVKFGPQSLAPYFGLLFVAAVSVSARWGGYGAGAVAMVLSPPAVYYFFLNPGSVLPSPQQVPGLVLYACMGAVLVGVLGRRRRTQQSLREANEALERRVTARTQELAYSYEKLRQAERLAAIGEMMAGLSHESRNALQRMSAGLQMLERHLGDPERARRLIEAVLKAGDDLKRVYEDVQEYAGEVRLDRARGAIAGVWRQAWEDLEVQRRGRQARLIEETVNEHLDLKVDPHRLKRVFRNLLENSLAACNDPAEITVACEECNGAGVRIRLCDNGPGLDEEQAARIFEPFYTTKTKGTGLGMAIAKRLVEAHGGRIAVDSRHGRGLEVIIELPTGD